MKSVDRLVAEHELIQRGLAGLEKFVSRIEAGVAETLDQRKFVTAVRELIPPLLLLLLLKK
ncbi:MAG: hypothetical protein GTO62_19115 [Planctomycetales bacterium]|nr:hypothetical protein [Planctomycetales bacterium]NIP86482.1 hypothetical protein [Planctomycetales bacterium]